MAITRRTSATNSRLRNGAHERVDAVADSLDSIRETAADYVDHSRERATEFARTFEDTIRERPLTSILIGTAVGFVLGCFMARR